MDTGEQSGFTLIETVIAMVVFVIALVAVTNLFLTDIQVLSLAKARSMGLEVANQQMEYLRDLPYNSVATQNGTIYPPVTISDNQTQTVGSYTFRIHTDIEYVDDPYDGNAAGTIPGKPVDLYPYDYKKAEVTVYLNNSNTQVATLTTNIAAKAAETSSNTGILSIKVLNADGQPVSNATVTITNPNESPAVNITTTTDNNGLVTIPKLPPDNNHEYHVTATQAGYSTDQTEPPGSGSQVAVNPNPNVLVQQITSVTLAIDQLGTLSANVVATNGNPISNLAVGVSGAKDTYTNPVVAKYSSTQTTNAQGNFSIANAEWDSYSFTVPNGYYIVSTSPYQPASLSPGANLSVALVVSTAPSSPTISSVSPQGAATDDTAATLTINGTNLSGSTVRLRLAGQSDIVASSVTGNASSLQAIFNLAGAAVGDWTIVVTNGAQMAIQTGGLDVTSN
jgi:prepilin-type N-terminal cleavage/methylation domain-containing protein